MTEKQTAHKLNTAVLALMMALLISMTGFTLVSCSRDHSEADAAAAETVTTESTEASKPSVQPSSPSAAAIPNAR